MTPQLPINIQWSTPCNCTSFHLTDHRWIKGFNGKGNIQSFYAPYYCLEAGVAEEKLLTPMQLLNPLIPPKFPCEGGVLELDDIAERYFAFLLRV